MRDLTTDFNAHIDNSEEGYALRPVYLVLIGGGVLPMLNYTTGEAFDYLGFTFSPTDVQVSRLSWDKGANQDVTLSFFDDSDTIRAYFLNRSATEEVRIAVYAGFGGSSFDVSDVYQVFEGFADGQEFGRGVTTVRAIAQDPRLFTPRHFVSKNEGFNWITKPGTYVSNGQTINLRPRT